MPDEPTVTGTRADHATRFQPGQSGNPSGMTVNARKKLGNAFITELGKDFEANGTQVLAALRETKPDKYCELIASLLPHEASLNVSGTVDAGAEIERLSSTLEFLRGHIERVGQDRGVAPSVPDGPLLLDTVRTEPA